MYCLALGAEATFQFKRILLLPIYCSLGLVKSGTGLFQKYVILYYNMHKLISLHFIEGTVYKDYF